MICRIPRPLKPASGLVLLFALGASMSVLSPVGATVRPCLTAAQTTTERPDEHKAFEKAVDLLGRKPKRKNRSKEQWLEVADLMCKAEEAWPEDALNDNFGDRRYGRYLPRYHLGRALYELGCYKAALDLFESSVLNDIKEKALDYKDFKKKLESSRKKVADGEWQKAGADCSDWQVPKPGTKSSDER